MISLVQMNICISLKYIFDDEFWNWISKLFQYISNFLQITVYAICILLPRHFVVSKARCCRAIVVYSYAYDDSRCAVKNSQPASHNKKNCNISPNLTLALRCGRFALSSPKYCLFLPFILGKTKKFALLAIRIDLYFYAQLIWKNQKMIKHDGWK